LQSVVIQFRLTKKDHKKLQSAANKKMVPMGTYVRGIMEKHLNEVKQ